MQVNFKSLSVVPETDYKSTTDASTTGVEIPETEAEVETSIASLFDNSASTSDVENPLALSIGSSTKIGTIVDSQTGEILEDPDSNPFYTPTIDELIARANEKEVWIKLDDWDTIKAQYEEALATYKADRTTRLEAINCGINVDRNKQMLELCDKAIDTIKAQLADIEPRKKELRESYQAEVAEFKKLAKDKVEAFNDATVDERSAIVTSLSIADANKDGWIGEPDVGIRIITDTSKGDVLLDPETNKVITSLSPNGTPSSTKWFDSDRKWVASDKGLTISDSKVGGEDCTWKVTGGSSTERGNHFDAKIDIAVPDYIVVKAEDGSAITDVEEDGDGRLRMKPLSFKMNGSSIVQEPSTDLENYIQVKVKRVEVTSEETKDGKGYDQIVKFITTDESIAAEIRITGTSGKPASDYGFSLNAGEGEYARTQAISVDAKAMKSTSNHKSSGKSGTLGDYYDEYDVDLSKLDESANGKKDSAFNATMDKFSGSGCSHVEEGSIDATGLMVYGLTGAVVGARDANNLVFFGETQVKTVFSEDGEFDKNKALNMNVYKGGTQFDAVYAKGIGDLYAREVTLAWNDSRSSLATTAISVKSSLGTKIRDNTKQYEYVDQGNGTYIKKEKKEIDKNSTSAQDRVDIAVQVFAYLGGNSTKFIDNPADDDKFGGNGEDEGALVLDDYFNTEKQGTYSIANTGSTGDPDADTNTSSDDEGAIPASVYEEKLNELEDAIFGTDDEEDDPYKELDIDNLGGDVYNETFDTNREFFTGMAEYFGYASDESDDEEEYEESDDTVTKDGVDIEE